MQNLQLHRAALASDADAVRSLLADKSLDVNERDESHQTPLMLAACKGDLENCWMLVDAGADVKAKDKSGNTALSIARERGFTDPPLMDLLGGVGGANEADASRPLMPDDFSSDEEAPAAVDIGPAVVLDHTAKLTTTLSLFAWEQYETALARLAGVEPECVFVTPEPGSGSIEAHATIIKRLKSGAATSTEGIDEVMRTVKSLRQKEKLMAAAGGGAGAGRGGRVELVGLAEVKLIGEGSDTAEEVKGRVHELAALREEYHGLKSQHCEAKAKEDAKAMMLAASKAILLLRPARAAIEDAAAKSKAAVEQRRKRLGGGGAVAPLGSSFASSKGAGVLGRKR